MHAARAPARGDGREHTLQTRLYAASVAASVAAVVVNPLDVIKTRIQAHGAARRIGALSHAIPCPASCPTNGNAVLMCSPSCEPSAWRMAREVMHKEGARGLWRGTGGALVAAFPTVGIYLPCYDYALERLVARCGVDETLAPALAGAGSRALAVFAVAPLELARTRVMATKRGAPGVYGQSGGRAFVGALRESASTKGGKGGIGASVRQMWTGVGPTLARDVPYSAMYWVGVEQCRSALGGDHAGARKPHSMQELAMINFVSGVVSGAVVATLTTPLDVVKTRVQIRDVYAARDFASSTAITPKVGYGHGVWNELTTVARNEGIGALFAGWGPRAARAAPTGAIVLMAYELVKATVDV